MVTKPVKKVINNIFPVVVFIFILILWEFVIWFFAVPQYLFPAPIVIAQDIYKNIDSLLYHSSITFYEALLGFIIANIVGLSIAVIFSYSKTIKKGLYPYVIAFKTAPIVAVAPLLILWFGNGLLSKVICAAITAFFPIIINAIKGFESVDEASLNLFKNFSATKWQIFYKLRLPASLPYIFSALKISTYLTVIGAIIGEFTGSNEGIGFYILTSSYRIETVQMFSGIIMAGLIGIFFFSIISFIEKKIIFWASIDDNY